MLFVDGLVPAVNWNCVAKRHCVLGIQALYVTSAVLCSVLSREITHVLLALQIVGVRGIGELYTARLYTARYNSLYVAGREP